MCSIENILCIQKAHIVQRESISVQQNTKREPLQKNVLKTVQPAAVAYIKEKKLYVQNSDTYIAQIEVLPTIQKNGSPVVPKQNKKAEINNATIQVPIEEKTKETKPSAPEQFPAFGRARHIVASIPNWGAMRNEEEWSKSYAEMSHTTFVPVPSYNVAAMQEPMSELAKIPIADENIPAITRKLYYSTRYFGSYNLDSGEFEAKHSGIDLKLALGTPVRSIGGGRIHDIGYEDRIGKYVTIEHHLTDGIYFSIYGHLGSSNVSLGQNIAAGTIIGTVGMTGNTSGPHIHLQVDKDTGARPHVRYQPNRVPSKLDVQKYSMNPIAFIESHR